MAKIKPIMLDSTGSSMKDELRLLNIANERQNFLLQLISDSMMESGEVVECQSLTLSKTSIYNDKEESDSLTVTKTPENTTRTARFYSTDPHVATVDDDGGVWLVSDGECKIHAVCGKKRAVCSVKVETLNKADTVQIVEGNQSLTYPYPSAKLTTSITPTTYNRGVTWSSDDETVASVDSTGHVTFVSTGTTIIRATTLNGKTSAIRVTTEMGVYGKVQVNVQLSVTKNSSGKYRLSFGTGQSRCVFLQDALLMPVKAGQVITYNGYKDADMFVYVLKTDVDITSLTIWRSDISKDVKPFVKNGTCYAYPEFINANNGTGQYPFDLLYSGQYKMSDSVEQTHTVSEDGYAIVTYKFVSTTDMAKVDGEYVKTHTMFEISG